MPWSKKGDISGGFGLGCPEAEQPIFQQPIFWNFYAMWFTWSFAAKTTLGLKNHQQMLSTHNTLFFKGKIPVEILIPRLGSFQDPCTNNTFKDHRSPCHEASPKVRGQLRVGGDESSETGSLHGFFSGNHWRMDFYTLVLSGRWFLLLIDLCWIGQGIGFHVCNICPEPKT